MDQLDGNISAEERAAFARDPVVHAARRRSDGCNRRDAEDDAREKHAEAAGAAAKLAEGEAEGRGKLWARSGH
jgi:hypothetical protein